MIRGDILRTKTTQVSAEHQRETSRLGELRHREAKARGGVQTREERFWREVAQVSAARGESRRPHTGNPSLPIARALEAHRLLQKAKDEHHGLTGQVREQVTRVLKVKVALEAFSKMQKRERMQHAYRRADRFGEEIGEIKTCQRIRHGGGALLRRGCVHDESGDVSDVFRVAVAGGPAIERLQKEDQGAPPILSPLQTKPTDSPVPVSEALALQAVHAATSEHGATLQLRIESSGTPVACQLASNVAGEVGVVVQAPRGEFLQRVERQRAGLITKLSELGIKITSFEVRRDSGLSSSGGGFLRRGRRTREERDENAIA